MSHRLDAHSGSTPSPARTPTPAPGNYLPYHRTAVEDLDEAALLQLMGAYDEVPVEEWEDRALCAQTDPEAFFPEKGGSTRAAKSTCRRCPVRAECLDKALSQDERFGIWGGLTERERRQVKRERVGGQR